ncbi:MAG TPA: hypothetical protein V6D08_13500, partial [Candidatus Obscuribacterales bacterium]
ADRSSLSEYPLGARNGSEHVEALSSALSAFGSKVRQAIDQTASLQDADTADIFTEISRGVDKYLWFVESHAQGEI